MTEQQKISSQIRLLQVLIVSLSSILLATTTCILILKTPAQIPNHSNNHRQLSPAPTQKAAIACLIPGTPNDLRDFCLALRSLESLPVTDPSLSRAPVVAFHEGDVSPAQQEMIRGCTDRPVSFPLVVFDFPVGFDAAAESMREHHRLGFEVKKGGSNLGRNDWGYAQMIRFWTSKVWHHPALAEYDTVMRIDTDSCFRSPPPLPHDPSDVNLPSLSLPTIVYRSKSPGVGIDYWIKGLWEFTLAYMAREGITPSHPTLWRSIEETMSRQNTLRTVGTHFEISRLSFFRREDVSRWLTALTEEEPFGVFRFRWGDAQTRLLTLAMFGSEESVVLKDYPGYKHGRQFVQSGVMGPSFCSRYFNHDGRIHNEDEDII